MEDKVNIFIVGCKGIPANYGGFETFVDQLVLRKQNKKIKYHVACLNHDKEEIEYNGARCFNITIPEIGSAKAVFYDIKALKKSVEYIKNNNIKNGIVYVLDCRIGPFFNRYVKILHKLNFKVYVNPDGHEWKRAKWNWLIKKYWKFSEKLMIKNTDFLICDSLIIEKYIKEEYQKYNPKTIYIAYGADLEKSRLKDSDKKLLNWYKSKGIKPNEYYLIVGRFVPENNYETIIKEFMKSKTEKDLVIITNVEKNKFYNNLKIKTNFDRDKRIKFVGTVYDNDLIKKIRENAYGYFHGHEVGGTNPSLLEALASTKINLLVDVDFNKEVALDTAIYWNKEENNLANIINKVDLLSEKEIENYNKKSTERIKKAYTWDKIVNDYEKLFVGWK